MRPRLLVALAASVLLVGCGASSTPAGDSTADAGGEAARYRAAAPQNSDVITAVNQIGPRRYAVRTSLPDRSVDRAMALCQELATNLKPLPDTFVVRDGGGNIIVTFNHPRHPGQCAGV